MREFDRRTGIYPLPEGWSFIDWNFAHCIVATDVVTIYKQEVSTMLVQELLGLTNRVIGNASNCPIHAYSTLFSHTLRGESQYLSKEENNSVTYIQSFIMDTKYLCHLHQPKLFLQRTTKFGRIVK